MKLIGPHVSTTGGVFNAPLNAKALGATAFGMFSKNQRRWESPPYDQSTIALFKKNLKEADYSSSCVLTHDSYLINIGNPDPAAQKKSLDACIDELTRCDQLGLKALNMHPGSHLKLVDETECLDIIAKNINTALAATGNVAVVLETTSGQGSNVGYRFEHLAHIIKNIDDKKRVGVCVDTCHIFAAGYDIRTEKGYHQVMEEFDKVIGFRYLMGMHLNDSKGKHGSHLDRHHSLGQGELGLEPFRQIMNDSRLDGIPLILETIDESIWAEEIKLLYSFVK
jgi:deoxyribonuclease-4